MANKTLDQIVADITDSAFDSGRFSEVEFKLANWEDDWTAENEWFRNYRNSGHSDFAKVVEHATRRGPNLELQIRVQLGNVADFPEDVTRAKSKEARKQEAAKLRERAEAEKARIDRETEERVNLLLNEA